MEKKVPWKRKRGSPDRRYLDSVRDAIKGREPSGEEVCGRTTWIRMSLFIGLTYNWEQDEEEENEYARLCLLNKFALGCNDGLAPCLQSDVAV